MHWADHVFVEIDEVGDKVTTPLFLGTKKAIVIHVGGLVTFLMTPFSDDLLCDPVAF